ncbi:MAG: S-layer homology domain-containing protein, partial [Firmicutes bacterium]|nr:S-layer homology domain-containing protein [Bacillota bacterium]
MKKIISIVLSITLLSGMTAYAVEYGEELKNMPSKTYEQKFSDVPTSHWAFGYIAELVNDNVLSGYPDGKFYPNNNVTRAEFAKIMISASGVKVTPATYTSFSDVATTDWYCPYIESAKEFLTGYSYGGSA